MRLFTALGNGQAPAPASQIPVELLEGRRLLSASIVVAGESTVAALDVTAVAGTKFKDSVGTWASAGGLPAAGSGVTAVATVDWGDGKTSRAKLVDDGSGTIQIIGSHKWAKPGTFQTLVQVEEISKGHPKQITDIGQSGAEAVVAPHPHAISLKGTLTGAYTTPVNNPDARSYDFTGSGTTHAMGAVTVTGSITPPGFILSGQAHGEFVLTAANGTVTFDVTGSTQNGGGPLPSKLHYEITTGTGAFANTRGKGTISVALDTTANTFVLVIH